MSESPPPMIAQLAGVLSDLEDRIEDGSSKMILRHKLGLAKGLVDGLAATYPMLSAPAGTLQMTDWELRRRGL